MTGVTIIGPTGKQTGDDHLTEVIHHVFSGKGDRRDLAPLTPEFELRLMAISELVVAEDKPHVEEFDGRSSKLVTAVYNIPESVYRDLEMSHYGVAPMVPHLFPVMDSFTVLGNLRGNYAGFGVDFFGNVRRPTKTVAFAQNTTEDIVRRTATEIFNLENATSEQAYTETGVRSRKISLKPYGKDEEIDAVVVDGTLQFGAKGKLQNDITKGLMESCAKHEGFTPEQYVLRHYDFSIDFGSKDSQERFRRGLDALLGRVQLVFQDKADKYAA